MDHITPYCRPYSKPYVMFKHRVTKAKFYRANVIRPNEGYRMSAKVFKTASQAVAYGIRWANRVQRLFEYQEKTTCTS